MTIKAKPEKLAAFIAKAPDAAAEKQVTNQAQVSVKMTTELLSRIDAVAKDLNLTRAGCIKMLLANALREKS